MTLLPQSFVPQQLIALSEEVSRIAAALAKLSAAFVSPGLPIASTVERGPGVSAEAVAWIIKARTQRARYLATDFCDPAWDILLDLLRAELSGQRVSVSSVCIAAGAPQTTALRYIQKLAAEGAIVRRADPFDGRRIFVELAPETSAALRQYVADVVQPSLLTTAFSS